MKYEQIEETGVQVLINNA